MATKKGNAGLYILVDDLRRYASSPIEPYLAGLVVTDALGRGWIANDDAAAVLASAEAEWRAEMQRRSDHDAWLKDRQARRLALVTKVGDKVLAGKAPNASNYGAVREAQRQALEEFDQREPELDYYRWVESRSTMAAAR